MIDLDGERKMNNLLIELKRLKALEEFNKLRERMNNSPQVPLASKQDENEVLQLVGNHCPQFKHKETCVPKIPLKAGVKCSEVLGDVSGSGDTNFMGGTNGKRKK